MTRIRGSSAARARTVVDFPVPRSPNTRTPPTLAKSIKYTSVQTIGERWLPLFRGQPNLRKQRGSSGIVDGVAGGQATYVCIVPWFVAPVLSPGQSIVLRVDGVYYPLYQAGLFPDPAGQRVTYEIGLEQGQQGR